MIEAKKQQKEKGVKTIFSHLDIYYVLQKFMELDKLKMLLLDDNQFKLFEYLPKPIILKTLKIDLNFAGNNDLSPNNKSEMQIEDDLIGKAKNVQKAYNNIVLSLKCPI